MPLKIALNFQRERTRKHYTDDWAFGDDDIEGRRNFQVEEKLESDKYNLKNFHGLYREMTGAEFNVAYIQKHGFGIPVLIQEKTGLGIRIPSSNFNVNDVRTCVGKYKNQKPTIGFELFICRTVFIKYAIVSQALDVSWM